MADMIVAEHVLVSGLLPSKPLAGMFRADTRLLQKIFKKRISPVGNLLFRVNTAVYHDVPKLFTTENCPLDLRWEKQMQLV